MGVVHGGGWFIRSPHVALIYSPKPRIYLIHYAFVGAEKTKQRKRWDGRCTGNREHHEAGPAQKAEALRACIIRTVCDVSSTVPILRYSGNCKFHHPERTRINNMGHAATGIKN